MSDHAQAVLVFEVPGEPAGKGRPIAGKSFKGFTTLRTPEKTATYERTLAWIARQAMGQAGVRELLQGPLWMHITAFKYPPKALEKRVTAGEVIYVTTKPDFDNIAKICCDALNAVAYKDDAQIADGRVIKRYSMLPRVVVSIGRLVDELK